MNWVHRAVRQRHRYANPQIRLRELVDNLCPWTLGATLGRPGRTQGGLRGATPEINELATFLRTMTAETTVRDLANRYRSGKTLWSLYRSGARVVPWHLLERVVTDRIGDERGRTIALSRAKHLHTRAEASADRVQPATAAPASHPAPEPEDNPPTSKDNTKRRWWELVAACVLAVVCTLAVVRSQTAEPAEDVPPAPTAPAGLYAMSADRGSVLWWNAVDGDWLTVGGPASELLVGGAGVFATHPRDGRIYRYQGRPNDWALVGERGAELAADATHLYRLSPDRDMVWQWTPATATWTIIGGPAAHLYAGAGGLYATTPDDGRIMRYNGNPGNWSQIGDANDPRDTYAVGPEQLYRLSAADGTVWEWSARTGSWTGLGGAMRTIRAGGSGLYAIDRAAGSIHHQDGEWTPIGTPAADLAVTDTAVYRLSAANGGVAQWHAETRNWEVLAGPVAAIGAI